MKHEKGVGCFSEESEASKSGSFFPRVDWEGLGKEMKHEQGFGCFMVPKRGVGRLWEGSGKAKNEA